MTTKRVVCIFCGQRRERGREDIVTDWLSTALGPTGAVFTDFLTDIPGEPIKGRYGRRSGDLRTIKLKKVCKVCNGGWMSRLERAAQPLLTRLVQGEATVITPQRQRLIAAWGQLKCVSLDAYYEQEYRGVRHLPARVANEFCRRTQPLTNSMVVVGRYDAPSMGVELPWGRLMLNKPATTDDPEIKAVVTTFAFGHLFIQVCVGAWAVPHDVNIVFNTTFPELVQCWPANLDGDFQWPPSTAITPTEFRRLAGPNTRIGTAS
jgi:hypothetical protein